jgi:hypothetical protein
MAYSIYYELLNEKKEVTKAFDNVACFSSITNHNGEEFFRITKAHYLLFNLANKSPQLSDEQVYKYLLFLKHIPEFTPYMPYDVLKVSKDLEITFDLTKMNGLILFSLLTVVRAIIEDPDIVKAILKFDPEKEYSWDKLGILKACGSVHNGNNGHWLTQSVSLKNINKTPATKADWKSTVPAKETGLISLVHNTWQYTGDGYVSINCVKDKDINDVLNGLPKVVVVVKKPKAAKKVDLQLDF